METTHVYAQAINNSNIDAVASSMQPVGSSTRRDKIIVLHKRHQVNSYLLKKEQTIYNIVSNYTYSG